MDKVTELLTAEGWTHPDADGLRVGADSDQPVPRWNTPAGNKRREGPDLDLRGLDHPAAWHFAADLSLTPAP